jgi:hypothetical protein
MGPYLQRIGARDRRASREMTDLPLISETMERVGKTRWSTKLDVIASFHEIRITDGDERYDCPFRALCGPLEWLA